MLKEYSDSTVLTLLVKLYGEVHGHRAFDLLQVRLEKYHFNRLSHDLALTQGDNILITYGDQVMQPGELPLRTLADFSQRWLGDVIRGIHILPFYPYSSDDGFSVVDYQAVDTRLGSWEDISAMGKNLRLMFDAVINHISAQSEWFHGFLNDQSPYKDYFILVEGNRDINQVVRPRALPLLTRFTTPSGDKAVWTTFSGDQIDLNYQNPDVLINILEIILYYISQGAEFIRLDAIAYLWKEIGTPCIHLPQTHWIIQIIRAVLDQVAPWVMLITETNVPHKENISYFGNGSNEAQLVYNFALPPLILHTIHTGNCRTLMEWSNQMTLPSLQTAYLNFLASHDGIGLNPVRGILPDQAIRELVDRTVAHGGLVSYKDNPDGTKSPYELNINYFDALSDPNSKEPINIQVNRFLCAQAIMLAMVGVPAIYFHSLFGSRGWPEGVIKTGQARTINREKLRLDELEEELIDPNSLRFKVFHGYQHLLRIRASQLAFNPISPQRILDIHDEVFSLVRASPDGKQQILCLFNISDHPVQLENNLIENQMQCHNKLRELISGALIETSRMIDLEPYQVSWITPI